ncbi:hypothetical protein ACPUD8_15215 [Brevibacterium sp. FAM 25378]|uniref:hypothetical protein n=1 Tax=unclassified Brevibacterium TaxID=2614124 RepID=UPI001092BAFD|nr:hypothetical protein [Brevibacterium sp. S22]TGD30299.1 hypothetical protein EB835_13610 [Brevibacterium sp. S22]
MSSLASLLMVASGALCLIGAIAARRKPAVVAATVMVVAMVDLAYTALVPPVVWSGVLLIVGLCLTVFLRTQSRVPAPRQSPALVMSGPGGPPETEEDDCAPSASTTSDRFWSRVPHLGPSAAVLCAMAYPVMAWQVLNHGAHVGGSTHSGGHGGHHAGDMSLISTFLTVAVVALAACLVVCAIHDIARKRPLVSLDCWGMAAMIVVMQFLH